MRILEFTDPHINKSAAYSKPTDDGYTDYLQSVKESLKFVNSLIGSENIDCLVFGGDLFENPEFVDTSSLSVAIEAFTEISNRQNLIKLAIVGNHDYYSINHGIHTLGFLKNLGWKVFDQPGCYYPTNQDDLGFLMLPYRDHYESNELSAYLLKKPVAVFSHLDYPGCVLRKPRHGEVLSTDGVDLSVFKDGPFVFNGHYHHPSVKDNLINVGSLLSRNWTDVGSDHKGVVIFDTVTKEIKRFVNPYSKRFVEFLVVDDNDVLTVASCDPKNTYARIEYSPIYAADVEKLSSDFEQVKKVVIDDTIKENLIKGKHVGSLEDNLEHYIRLKFDKKEAGNYHKEAVKLLTGIISENADMVKHPLKFRRLVAHNFLTLENVDISLDSRGLLVIKGVNHDDESCDSNASGKSALIEAINYALTGNALRKKKGDDLINWNKKSMFVALEFETDAVYTTVRSRKDKKFKTGSRLYKCAYDDIAEKHDLSARLTKDTDHKIEQTIGRSEINLRQTCFLIDDMSSSFSKAGSNERLKLIEDIIDVQPYRIAGQVAKDKYQETSSLLANVSAEINTFEYNKNGCFDAITGFERQIESIKATVGVNVDGIKQQIASNQAEIAKLEQLIPELDKSYISLKSQENSVEAKLMKFRSEFDRVNSDGSAFAQQIRNIDNELAKHRGLQKVGKCPTCYQDINVATFTDTINKLIEDRSVLEAKSTATKAMYSKLQKRLAVLTDNLSRMRIETEGTNGEIRSAHNQINQFLQNISSLENELKIEESPILEITAKIEERNSMILNIEKSVKEKKKERDVLEKKLKLYEVLYSDIFSERGVRNMLIRNVAIPFINSQLPMYSNILNGGKSIQLSADKTLKSGDIRNDIDIILDGKYTYDGGSRGERRRIDFAIQLALNDLARSSSQSSIGLLVLDEVFDSLDELGIAGLFTLLRERGDLQTVLIVSHTKYAASLATNQIVVTKKDGLANITE